MGADISAIVGTMPERAGDVEVGKIMKRNVVFGGISWASRFICICGHNLHVLKPRLVGSGYTLVGTFDLLGTRVKTARDEFAQGPQEERVVRLEARSGTGAEREWRLWMRLRLPDERQCHEWARAFRQAASRGDRHKKGMERIHDALLSTPALPERDPADIDDGGADESKGSDQGALPRSSHAMSSAKNDLDNGNPSTDIPMPLLMRQGSYTILDRDQLNSQQQAAVEEARTTLPKHLTDETVRALLAHFKWDVQHLAHRWNHDSVSLGKDLKLDFSPNPEGDEVQGETQSGGAGADGGVAESKEGDGSDNIPVIDLDAELKTGSKASSSAKSFADSTVKAGDDKEVPSTVDSRSSTAVPPLPPATVTMQAPEIDTSHSSPSKDEELEMCMICCDESPATSFFSLSCGHRYCKTCWGSHLSAQLDVGREAGITAKCMSCNLMVTDDLYRKCLSQDAWEKVQEFRKLAYVDENASVRWCPNPHCEKAIYYKPNQSRDIKCVCGIEFCFMCGKRPHYPSTCEQFEAWAEKHKEADKESKIREQERKWLEEHTKPCPKCKTPIEKNKGCNHMTCKSCNHEFCWMCLADWSTHGASTGGYYQCNVFDPKKAAKRMRELRSQEFTGDRYTHYHRRFIQHEESGIFAQKQLRQFETHADRAMWAHQGLDMQFLIDTTINIVEMRHVLQWSYVFGFYLGEGIHCDYFEGLQGLLEADTERLHELAEAPMLMQARTGTLPFDSPGALQQHKHKVMQTGELVTRAYNEFKAAIVDVLDSGVRTAPKGESDGKESAASDGAAAAGADKAPTSEPAADIATIFRTRLSQIWDRINTRNSGTEGDASVAGASRQVQRWRCVLCQEMTQAPARGKQNAHELPRCRICDTPRIQGRFRERLEALQPLIAAAGSGNSEEQQMRACQKVVELGYSQPLAMKALRETGWTTPEAAINWILEHPGETELEFTRLERQASGGDEVPAADGNTPQSARWLTEDREFWICNICTLHNERSNARCEVCQQEDVEKWATKDEEPGTCAPSHYRTKILERAQTFHALFLLMKEGDDNFNLGDSCLALARFREKVLQVDRDTRILDEPWWSTQLQQQELLALFIDYVKTVEQDRSVKAKADEL